MLRFSCRSARATKAQLLSPFSTSLAPSAVDRIVAAAGEGGAKSATVSFEDHATFEFHALWLRDACRDASHVEGAWLRRVRSRVPRPLPCSRRTLALDPP